MHTEEEGGFRANRKADLLNLLVQDLATTQLRHPHVAVLVDLDLTAHSNNITLKLRVNSGNVTSLPAVETHLEHKKRWAACARSLFCSNLTEHVLQQVQIAWPAISYYLLRFALYQAQQKHSTVCMKCVTISQLSHTPVRILISWKARYNVHYRVERP